MRSHLLVQGMRARDLDLELGRLTLITGPMGSSKTTAADALRLLALGHVPALGKTEAATAALMRGQELGVRLELEDGRAMSRALKRTGKGIKGGATASWLDPKAKASEHAAAILDLFGEDAASAAEHLDLRELLKATPNQRAARLEGLLAATAFRADEVLAWLRVLTTCRMARQERVPEDLEAATALADGLVHGLSDPERQAIGYVLEELRVVFEERGLAGAIDKAGDVRRAEAKATKDGRAARSKIEDRRAGMTIPTDTIEDLERARDKATADQAALEERSAAYRKGATARAEADQALTDARTVLDALQEGNEAAGAALAECQRLRTEAEGVEIPEVPRLVLPEIDPALTQAVTDAERLAREHAEADIKPEPQRPDEPVYEDATPLLADLEDAEEALVAAATDPWAEVLGMAQRLHAAGVTANVAETPEGDEIRGIPTRLIAIAQDRVPDVAALEKAVTDARAAVKALEGRNDHHRKGWEAHLADFQKAHEAWAEAEAAHVAKGAPLQVALEEAQAAVATANGELRAERERLTDENQSHVQAAQDARDRKDRLLAEARTEERKHRDHVRAVQDAEAEVAEARARIEGMAIQEPVDLEEAATEITALAAKVTECQGAIDALQAADALDQELGEITSALELATVRLEAGKATEWALQRLRERDLATRGKPLTDRLRAFLHAAGMDVEPYVRAKPRALDFGWVTSGQDVPLQAMSGGETVLYMAGMAAAVITLRAPELRLLLIEGAECQDHLGQLMAGCAAVAEELTHAIITTQTPPPEIPEAWVHIRTQAAATAAT